MTDFPACYVVPPGASVTIGDPGLKASQHSTGGALSVFETSIDAGPPLHVHDREDECFYVLDGELSIRCGSQRRRREGHGRCSDQREGGSGQPTTSAGRLR